MNVQDCQFDPTSSSLKTTQKTMPYLLGPQQDCHRGKKTLVLDLDETLVVSVPSSGLRSHEKVGFHFTVTPSTGSFHVRKRPGLDDFLRAIASHFEVVVWTAAMKEYAWQILDEIDTRGVVKWRLTEEDCRTIVDRKELKQHGIPMHHLTGDFKELHRLGRPLSDCIMVDDNPMRVLPRENALRISCFCEESDGDDRALLDILPVLMAAAKEADLRGGRLSALDKQLRGSWQEWGAAEPLQPQLLLQKLEDGGSGD